MRLEWIEDILAVHDTGSLRTAAEIRFLTASAFTRRIRAVEEAVGGELFDRTKRPLQLRPHVLELIPRMREMAGNLRTIQGELSGAGEGAQITKLICQHTLTVSWAPKVASFLSQDGSRLRIRSGTKDECALAVLKNDTDLAIVYEDPDFRIEEGDDLFERFEFGTEQFIPVVSKNQFANLPENGDTIKLPIVAYPRTLFLGEALERTLLKTKNKRVGYFIVAEAGLGPAVLEFVREGLGVGWLPNSLIEDDLKTGELVSVSHLVPQFELRVSAIRSSALRSRRISKIWRAIESEFGQTP